MAKRNHGAAVRWLLDHGADANGRWAHWDAEVTPLHLAASQGHAEIVRLLLEAGADPRIRDSKTASIPPRRRPCSKHASSSCTSS